MKSLYMDAETLYGVMRAAAQDYADSSAPFIAPEPSQHLPFLLHPGLEQELPLAPIEDALHELERRGLIRKEDVGASMHYYLAD